MMGFEGFYIKEMSFRFAMWTTRHNASGGGLQVSSIDIITLTRIGNRSCACDNFILKWGVNPF